jgi:hypothetical protein
MLTRAYINAAINVNQAYYQPALKMIVLNLLTPTKGTAFPLKAATLRLQSMHNLQGAKGVRTIVSAVRSLRATSKWEGNTWEA